MLAGNLARKIQSSIFSWRIPYIWYWRYHWNLKIHLSFRPTGNPPSPFHPPPSDIVQHITHTTDSTDCTSHTSVLYVQSYTPLRSCTSSDRPAYTDIGYCRVGYRPLSSYPVGTRLPPTRTLSKYLFYCSSCLIVHRMSIQPSQQIYTQQTRKLWL